jgi:hypothetical protein
MDKEEVMRKIGNPDFSHNVTKPTNYYNIELENSEIIADTQFGEIYQALIQLTSRKEIGEKPRWRIGFKPDYK